MEKTSSFRIVLGVNEGYGSHTARGINLEKVAEAYKAKASEVFNVVGVYVSATMAESKTLYHADWGCPIGGEATVTFYGTANPQFTALGKYKEAVTEVAKLLKKEFGQSTVTVEFFESEMVYLA